MGIILILYRELQLLELGKKEKLTYSNFPLQNAAKSSQTGADPAAAEHKVKAEQVRWVLSERRVYYVLYVFIWMMLRNVVKE